jgi:branched-chain amino acid aminotransferase
MSDTVLWLDGELVRADEARVSPLDHGLLVGDGVFETLRVYDGVPFAWTRHHRRLVRSAAGLGLAAPGSQELRAAVDGPPTVIVVSAPATPWPAIVDVVVVPWTRNERGAVAGLKTTSYAENVRALAYARERDAGEAIFLNTRGELCEATGSNVFVVRDGVVLTPPADAGCLLGVTRALVLELCADHGILAEEAALGPAGLGDAEEAFLTSSTREVQPVGRVDGRALPAAPGPTTEKLARLLTELIARDPDP